MDDAPVLTRRKLTVEDYHRMGETGILGEDDRVELINGELIAMAPIGQGHAGNVTWLNRALLLACGDQALVSPQNPVRLDQLNEPQPDFAVLRPRADFYTTGERPGPADVLLLVEVANSSLRYDRTVKLPLYASAGIFEVWIVDLQARVLLTHRDPDGDHYRHITTHLPGDTLALALAPQITVRLDLPFG